MPQQFKSSEVKCDFCLKPASAVEYILKENKGHICNECVDVAVIALAQLRHNKRREGESNEPD